MAKDFYAFASEETLRAVIALLGKKDSTPSGATEDPTSPHLIIRPRIVDVFIGVAKTAISAASYDLVNSEFVLGTGTCLLVSRNKLTNATVSAELRRLDKRIIDLQNTSSTADQEITVYNTSTDGYTAVANPDNLDENTQYLIIIKDNFGTHYVIPTGGGAEHLYYCKVNKAGGVTAADTTFDVDDVDILTGETPPDNPEIFGVQNTKLEDFDDDEQILAVKNSNDGNYYAVKIGGGSSLILDHFELTQDLLLGIGTTTSAEAVLIDDIGVVTATVINVVDVSGRWMGHAAYTGADGTAQRGFRGFAKRFTADYDSSGDPGSHITAMEGFAPSIVVKLISSSFSGGQAIAELLTPVDFPTAGSNLCDRIPKDSGGAAVAIFDYHNLGPDLQQGKIIQCGWSQKNGEYSVEVPIRRFRQFLLDGPISPGTIEAFATDQRTGETIKVLDVCRVMTGWSNYDGANRTTQPPYCGVAEQFTSDYQNQGIPGCNIVSMEGPQPILVVELDSNITNRSQSVHGLVCDIPSTSYGSNYSGRVPFGTLSGAIVWNTCGFADNANAGEQWAALYQNDTQRYELVIRLGGGQSALLVLVQGIIGPAIVGTSAIAPGVGSALILAPSGGIWSDAGLPLLQVENHSGTSIFGPTGMRAHLISGRWVLDPFDLASLSDFKFNIRQVAQHDPNTDDFSLQDVITCP